LYNTDRYLLLGEICRRMAGLLLNKKHFDCFYELIQSVMPKSDAEVMAELRVTRDFFASFAGNGVRYLADPQSVTGSGATQRADHHRWPYGPVALITPFNFPLEIPALQLMGAIFMGNRVVLKPDQRTAIVAEALVEALLECQLPPEYVALLNCEGSVMEELITATDNGQPVVKLTLFTGSTRVADRLSRVTGGRVKFEDAGLGWKILGPHFTDSDVDLVATNSDHDAYSASGQKCSAQSILFPHSRWLEKNLIFKLGALAARRNFNDLTLSPVITWNNEQIQSHVDKICALSGAQCLFGGMPFSEEWHNVPLQKYGSYQPTAILLPLQTALDNRELIMTEVFAPFQLLIPWHSPEDLTAVLRLVNSFSRHLTAAVVDRDQRWLSYVLANTKPGTTYYGINAGTTGAPEWHHFGPTGHPANAGIGTREDIIQTWSQPRLLALKDLA
jgi:1-pyrroline-5-carboxylate dehydrogenase